MSQVVTRAIAAHDKEKRMDSPVRDSKKKTTPNNEKDKPEKKDETKDKDTKDKDPKDKDTKDKDSKDKDPKDKDPKAKDPKEKDHKVKDSKEAKDSKETKEQPPEKPTEKSAQNGKGAPKATNGHGVQPVVVITDLALNGDTNGAGVSGEDDVNMDDEQFPELAYDDDSDEDESPEPSRSVTRRSQVKATRTPETPRPASDKTDKEKSDEDKQDKEQGKETKLLKLKEDSSSVRKLRSADKANEKEGEDDNESRRETNYSRSRVKVSPYRRSGNDTTTMANYTGNNTTMEMDLTESSFMSQNEDQSVLSDRSGYSVRARKSYKRLKPVKFEKPPNSTVTVVNTSAGRRLCGAVVGRKRKPADDESFDLGTEQEEQRAPKKTRGNLFEKVMGFPFLRSPIAQRKSAQIVGINSDLPMSCPISVDPEVITPDPSPQSSESPIETAAEAKPANKFCIIM